MVARSGGGMKAHGEPRCHRLDVADLEQKIALPGEAIVFAVGSDPQPGFLLQPHDVSDRGLLDVGQLRHVQLALVGRLARRDEPVGPDQTADMVGTKWRLCALHDG